MQYPLTTVLVFDEHNNGYPVAWAVTSDGAASTIASFLKVVRDRALEEMPDWSPSAVIVDCDDGEIKAIRWGWGAAGWGCTGL